MKRSDLWEGGRKPKRDVLFGYGEREREEANLIQIFVAYPVSDAWAERERERERETKVI